MRSIFAIAIAVATVAACVASAAGQEEPPKAPAERARRASPLRSATGSSPEDPSRSPSGSVHSTSSWSTASWRTAGEVAALRARGATVLAYLSVGTIEKWRSWYPNLKPYRLAAWRDWKDEWFADVSSAKLRATLTDKIAPAILDKGFDGLFLDNVDMIETRSHRAQRPGMRVAGHRPGDRGPRARRAALYPERRLRLAQASTCSRRSTAGIART